MSVFAGNHMKSLHNSVEESLKNLRTSYIDILYVHWVGFRFVERVLSALTLLSPPSGIGTRALRK